MDRFYNSYQVFIYVQYKYSHEYLVLKLIAPAGRLTVVKFYFSTG